MNIKDPTALREQARKTREAALQALDDADALDIVANASERMLAAEADLVVMQSRIDAAKDSEEHDAAAFELVDAALGTRPIADALVDPLNLTNFTDCPAWIARVARPEIYRRIILSRAQGNAVSDAAFEAAVAAARKAWKHDVALLENVGGL